MKEAYDEGISTRSVDDRVKALGMSGFSRTEVSRLFEEINERLRRSSVSLSRGLAFPVGRRNLRKMRSNGRVVLVAMRLTKDLPGPRDATSTRFKGDA